MDGTFTYRTLLVAGMHFQDAYNYDIERVKRCVIHYAEAISLLDPTTRGRLIAKRSSGSS